MMFYFKKVNTSPIEMNFIVDNIDQTYSYNRSYNGDNVFGFIAHPTESQSPPSFLQAAIHEDYLPTGGENTYFFYYNYDNTLYLRNGEVVNQEWEEY